MRTLIALACSTALLAACNDAGQGNDAAEDRMEKAAEASAAAAGPTEAALGLTETQLIDADLIDAKGIELGSVERVLRDTGNRVDRLLVEIEDSNPDRFVEIPLTGLTPVTKGDDTDLSTTMTKQQLSALPETKLPQS